MSDANLRAAPQKSVFCRAFQASETGSIPVTRSKFFSMLAPVVGAASNIRQCVTSNIFSGRWFS